MALGLLAGSESGEVLLRRLDGMACEIERRASAAPVVVTFGDSRPDFRYQTGRASGIRSVIELLSKAHKATKL